MKHVNIVLATYKPNTDFFRKLLQSLNEQTYSNISLTIRDDSDDINWYSTITDLVKTNISNFNYTIDKNNNNLGSNKTFQLLTREAEGDYIAYCDQDDIWEKEKITKLVDAIEKGNGVISYSDLSIIDKDDNITANSFKDIQKRLQHVEGNHLFEYFLRRNSVTGCAMLIKSKVAKDAIPFCVDYYIHDHWLALFASSIGKIVYVPEPLIKYRIHGENQIGASMLRGIESREDYYTKKLLNEREKYKYLLANYKFNKYNTEAIKDILNWTEERISFFERRNIFNTISMIKKISKDFQLTLFEIAINYLPNLVSKKVISKVKT